MILIFGTTKFIFFELIISQYIEEYVNLMVQLNPDNNNGQVIFLRGYDFSGKGENGSLNEPLIKVGHEGIFIPKEKSVFFPVVMAVADSTDKKLPDNEMARREYVRNTLNCCEYTRSDQITITKFSGNEVYAPKNLTAYIGSDTDFHPQAHRVESSEFTIHIPDTNEGNY